MHVNTVNRNRVDLCLQGSGHLCMCGSQTDRNTARIKVFLDDLLSGIWSEFDEICFLLKGGARLLGHALLLGHIR